MEEDIKLLTTFICIIYNIVMKRPKLTFIVMWLHCPWVTSCFKMGLHFHNQVSKTFNERKCAMFRLHNAYETEKL